MTVMPCPDCLAQTFLRCGNKPAFSESHNIHDCDIAWCCWRGWLIALWTILSQFDDVELNSRKDTPKTYHRNTDLGASSLPPGVGFDESHIGHRLMRLDWPWDKDRSIRSPEAHQSEFELDKVVGQVMDLVVTMLPSLDENGLPSELQAVLELSLFGGQNR